MSWRKFLRCLFAAGGQKWRDRQSDESHSEKTSDYSRGLAQRPAVLAAVTRRRSNCLSTLKVLEMICDLLPVCVCGNILWGSATEQEKGRKGEMTIANRPGQIFCRCGVRPEHQRGGVGWSGRWNNRGIISLGHRRGGLL